MTRSKKSSDSSRVSTDLAGERLNVFKLATDKLVYITKSSEEIVVVIANTSELNRRIELTPNRFVALLFRFTRNFDIVKSHIGVKVSALHRNLVGYV